MYLPYAQLTLPPDHQSVWRYISFTKFVSMLNDQSLFFCGVDRLKDKWEGVYPKGLLDYWSGTLAEVPSNDGKKYSLKDLIVKRIIPSHFVNCWYVSEFESDAMWRLYSQNDEGIAIRSTIGRLKKSFEKTPEQVWIGKVHYIDYDQWTPPENGNEKSQFVGIEPFFWKRISFSYENELRALIYKEVSGNTISPGLDVNADLKELIDSVYVFPDSKDWFIDLVQEMLVKYDHQTIRVTRSSLGERPWGNEA
jgi:hypothetical protein